MSTSSSKPSAAHTPSDADRRRPNSELDRLLTIAELSEYLGVPVATIYDWRVDGKGPRGLRIGRHLRFSIADVRAWLASLREA